MRKGKLPRVWENFFADLASVCPTGGCITQDRKMPITPAKPRTQDACSLMKKREKKKYSNCHWSVVRLRATLGSKENARGCERECDSPPVVLFGKLENGLSIFSQMDVKHHDQGWTFLDYTRTQKTYHETHGNGNMKTDVGVPVQSCPDVTHAHTCRPSGFGALALRGKVYLSMASSHTIIT